MTVDWAGTTVLCDPDDKRRFGYGPEDFSSAGLPVLVAPYHRIGFDEAVDREIAGSGAEALIFTRNDDMPDGPPLGDALRRLRVGYTTVSAIDPDRQDSQTARCMRDLIERRGTIDTPPVVAEHSDCGRQARGTFSIIFDLEQFGGARYGMPRLLPELERRGVRAVFFVTGFITAIYPELLERIAAGGHEIGVHGAVHEFLQGRTPEEQYERVRGEVDSLSRFGDIRGANFIFRMDAETPAALVRSGLRYFVLFRKHLFHRTRFLTPSARPRVMRTDSGDATLFPVSVETYGLGFRDIRRSLDSAVRTAARERTRHVSILLHPFKDGALTRLDVTRRLLDYCLKDLALRPITLSDAPVANAPGNDAPCIVYPWDGKEREEDRRDVDSNTVASWWTDLHYRALRCERLADGLEAQGESAVLTSDASTLSRCVCVYPDSCGDAAISVPSDALVNADEAALRVLKELRSAPSVQLTPPGLAANLVRRAVFHIPSTAADVAILARRAGPKLRRMIFRGGS